MGESLIVSWLRHVKECQVVQTNWKISNHWKMHQKDNAEQFFKIVKTNFGNEIFKQSSIQQMIKQSEIDVLGLVLEKDKYTNLYVVDIAYHESGLNYGSADKTINNIIKKMARAAITTMTAFDTTKANIIFASPKINNNILTLLENSFETLNALSRQSNLGFTFELITNEDFYHEIVEPVLELSNEIADTSELFLRSVQLLKLSEKKKQVKNSIFKVTNEETIQQERPKTIPIDYIPKNSKDFKKQLLTSRQAYIKLIYEDGADEIKSWDATDFSESSDLKGNVRSKDWFKPTKNYRDPVHGKVVQGIVSIEQFVD